MPSGITAAIYEGKDVSLRDYLMGVGRHMGFAIMQRDDPTSEPVTTTEPYCSYYDELEQTARARIAYLGKMKPEHIAAEAHAEHVESHEAWAKYRDERENLRARYEQMLRRVEAWKPEPLVSSTKEHALRYLRESIEFDCSYVGIEPVERDADADTWFRDEMRQAVKDLEYAQTTRAEEIERTTDRNRHIDAFLRSLPTTA